MALTTTTYGEVDLSKDDRPDLPPPPAVAITPCDGGWPRPYYFKNGLRRVAPYHYTYNTYCKQRWRDREILDIFAAEFRDRSREYYKDAIEAGQIVLNGKPCKDVHTKVKNGDVVSHTLHRHEPPVSAQPVRVINETDSMIVIDKPAGVPVHPAGRYKYNSIVEIMRAERHYAFNPLPCNRLDRLTSGVMFIGKTSKEAEEISAKLRGRTVRKEYIARVKGRFPDGEGWEGDPMRGGIVKCEEPILTISPILGLNRARASGKTAKTLFRRVAYYPPKTQPETTAQNNGRQPASAAKPLPHTEDEGYSIVHCLPLTGRTHQIRVHLQFLGHPISNDPIYSNRRVFGPSLAKGDSTADNDAEIKERLSNMGKTELADAYAYNTDNPTKIDNIEKEISGLNITQTQQTTPTQLEQLRGQELQRQYGSTAGYKPMNRGSLHAGSLPPDSSTFTNDHSTASPESDPTYASLIAAHDEMVQDYNIRKGEKLTGKLCDICQTPLYSDPGPQELGIYLHALAYADVGGEWRFTSPMPVWTRGEGENEEVMESPEWDYAALGKEADWVDVEAEREEGERRNRRGEERNKNKNKDKELVVEEG
ncbi:DRAP deaminase [Lithohypha guttulata]|nr:DRAP deaminase [Lithohypha guttulata]